ncbi:glycosyltransferase family 4 protein [Flavobacterium ardleyense]|uniref:Glycosyltransferase family 4 protein n=1 Tax=Flavobacterium ardleyense TaxID=2038737 RepID=A0ABW5ZA82_9FLAO
MKIAFLTPEYPHTRTGISGGIGTSIKNLAESLVNLGHSVRILVYAQKEDAVFDDGSVVVQQIRNVKIKGLSWFFTRKKIEKIINELYKNKEIDIVEAPDWTGITSFMQPENCPVIIRLNGSDTYFCHLDKRPVKWWNRFHEKRALVKANGHISVSQFTADTTNKLFGLAIPFTIIPNGINVDNFRRDQLIKKEDDTILYFGTLIRKKGVLELASIFNSIVEKKPDARLILVGKDTRDIVSGNNSTWKMMQEIFSHNALEQVEYLGGVSYAEVREYIAKAAVCVFPSFAEALPVSWLEAMAMEKAIVASNIGWAQEMIETNKEGYLVDPKSHENFATAIIHLLEDENQNTIFGSNAMLKVNSVFNNRTIAEKSVIYYQSFLNM